MSLVKSFIGIGTACFVWIGHWPLPPMEEENKGVNSHTGSQEHL